MRVAWVWEIVGFISDEELSRDFDAFLAFGGCGGHVCCGFWGRMFRWMFDVDVKLAMLDGD